MPDPSKSITYQLALKPKETAPPVLPSAAPISIVSQMYKAAPQDNTRVDRGMKPRKDSSIAFPMNRMVGDCVGSKLHPLALAAGAGDAAIMAGAYKLKKPYAIGLRVATRGINELPIDWKKQCEEGKRNVEEIEDELNKGLRQFYYPSELNEWLK